MTIETGTIGRTTRVLMNPRDIVDRNIPPPLSDAETAATEGMPSYRSWDIEAGAELSMMPGQLAPRWCICRQKDFECAETCGWKEYPDDH